MNANESIRAKLKENLPWLRQKYGIKSLGVFGSYARAEQRPASDVDMLVEFEKPVSLLQFIALENELADLLGKKVDLVVKNALKPRIGKHILREVDYL